MLFDRDTHTQRRVRQANLVRVGTLTQAETARSRLRRAILRLLTKDRRVPLARRLLASQRLRALPRGGTAARFIQRCRVSGRPRQVLRFAGLARMHFRQQHHERLLPLVAQKRW